MSASLPNQKKLIQISEAAKFLGVSIDTVRRWDKSGVLVSQRPDGKNRYFSLYELEKHKFSQPLAISEVAKKLSISPTTLRRLEARGVFVPKRNTAGERIYDKDSIEKFLSSNYFLRKKQVEENILDPLQEERLSEDLNIMSGTQPPEKTSPADNTQNYPGAMPAQLTEKILDPYLKPAQRIPEFLAAAVIFSLLIAIGFTNIQVSTIKGSQTSPTPVQPVPAPAILSETETENLISSPAPAVLSITTEATSSADAVIPKIIAVIKITGGAESTDVQREPASESEKIGTALNGDTFDFISINSGWYGVKLADGSTGYISAAYVEMMEETDE